METHRENERMASEHACRIWDSAPASPSVLDCLYSQVDKLYYGFARSCGLSSCAFWIIYDLYQARGQLEMRALCDSWNYSKQTINSALKTLEGRGLIEIDYVEGSRKNKLVKLTDDGTAFAMWNLRPAVEAEWRAFEGLSAKERQTLVGLLKKYAAALEREMAQARGIVEERGDE